MLNTNVSDRSLLYVQKPQIRLTLTLFSRYLRTVKFLRTESVAALSEILNLRKNSERKIQKEIFNSGTFDKNNFHLNVQHKNHI